MMNEYEYKVQGKTPYGGLWLDVSIAYDSESQARNVYERVKSSRPDLTLRIVRRMCPDWKDVTAEVVSHEEN